MVLMRWEQSLHAYAAAYCCHLLLSPCRVPGCCISVWRRAGERSIKHGLHWLTWLPRSLLGLAWL